MRIHGQLMRDTYEQIKAGAVSEFPLESDFIQTPGGPISSQELLVILYQEFGDKPFIIITEHTDIEPKVSHYTAAATSDKLRER